MNPQLLSFIQWLADGLVALVLLYTGWVHSQIKELQKDIAKKHETLSDRISTVQLEIATFESTRSALERMENKLDALSDLVHRLAGRQGID